MPLKENDPVDIHESTPAWRDEFQRLATAMRDEIGASRVEHIGSTAVPGLAAKPIIDFAIVYSGPGERESLRSGVALLGYESEGEKGVAGREAFRRSSEEVPTTGGAPWMDHHLYLTAADSDYLRVQLTFRDYLREHREVARRYEMLKRALARAYRTDREEYTEAKGGFVRSVLRQAAIDGVPGGKRNLAPGSDEIEYSVFAGIEMRAGIVLEAAPLENARKPAIVMEIDFGPLGIRKSSAQITGCYSDRDLLGKQVVAVVNLPPMQVGNIISECLVLGAESGAGISLLRPDHVVAAGERVY